MKHREKGENLEVDIKRINYPKDGYQIDSVTIFEHRQDSNFDIIWAITRIGRNRSCTLQKFCTQSAEDAIS